MRQDGVVVDVRKQATGDVVPPTELRRAGLVALTLLFVLNIADVVLTEPLLDRGGIELNPLADRLLASNSALLAKLAIVGLLTVHVVRQPPRLIVLCFMWLAVGIYLFVVVINASQLVAVWS